MSVGFIGTGAIGTAMVERLLATGHDVVVHNRTRANAAAALAAGATWADTPGGVAGRCEVVLSCLRDTAATEQVYLGGLLAEAAGTVLVEHGTFAPSLARRVAAAARDAGADFLAAPVSGGPEGARAGTLSVMVGGDAAAFERARPVLACLAGPLSHVGGPGAGLELKLVNQLLVSAQMAVSGEAVALLRRLGADLAVAAPALGGGWAQSAMLTRTLDLVAAGRLDDTGATIGGMAEVLALVADLLGEQHLAAPVFEAGLGTFAAAVLRGLGEADPAALHLLSEDA